MMNNMIAMRLRLGDATEQLLLARYTESDRYAKNAKRLIAAAFVPEAPYGEEMDWFKDLIRTAITDSHDIDSTDEDAAQAVIDALLGHIAIKADEESEVA